MITHSQPMLIERLFPGRFIPMQPPPPHDILGTAQPLPLFPPPAVQIKPGQSFLRLLSARSGPPFSPVPPPPPPLRPSVAPSIFLSSWSPPEAPGGRGEVARVRLPRPHCLLL